MCILIVVMEKWNWVRIAEQAYLLQNDPLNYQCFSSTTHTHTFTHTHSQMHFMFQTTTKDNPLPSVISWYSSVPSCTGASGEPNSFCCFLSLLISLSDCKYIMYNQMLTFLFSLTTHLKFLLLLKLMFPSIWTCMYIKYNWHVESIIIRCEWHSPILEATDSSLRK